MRILIISKCPTHPTNAGNRWWILSQAEMFKSLGHDVYFLHISEMPLRQNSKAYFESINIELVDFKIEFGKTPDGQIILADEISPDTCRLWDATTHEKLDKDRFRRDMGNVEEAYAEVFKRLGL